MRVKVVNGYAGMARFMATLEQGGDGLAVQPGWTKTEGGRILPVFRFRGQFVYIMEPHHRRYEVYSVPDSAVREQESDLW